MRQSLKNLFEDSDPYGTDEQFANYIKAGYIKLALVIISCLLMAVAVLFI